MKGEKLIFMDSTDITYAELVGWCFSKLNDTKTGSLSTVMFVI